MFSICASTLFLAALAQADSNVTAHVPQAAPSDAFKVPADFFGFGWESGLVPHYNNTISVKAVKAIGKQMDKDPVIRIGGTSGDHIYFDPNQQAATTCDSGPLCKKNSKDTFYIGPSYFDTFRLFQKNTTAPMSIQAPMGPDMPMNYTVAYVEQAWKALGSSRVAAIALGNEPNWYKDADGNRITAKKYVDDALKVETRLNQKLQGDSSPVYQIAEIASQGVTKEGNPFNMTEVVDQGLNKNGTAKYAAEHYYQLTDSYSNKTKYTPELLQSKLMNHAAIKSQLKYYTKDVSFLRQNNLSLIISEVGSALGVSPPAFGGGFGAAMWAVDFHLAAMAGGIQQVCNTQEPGATHSFWVPDDTGNNHTHGPSVQGVFVAAAFITDFVGKGSNLGKVSEIDLDNKHVSGYVSYSLKSDEPQRIALVNLKEWNQGSTADRNSTSVTLNVGSDVKSAVVRRMSSEGGSFSRGYDLGGEGEVVTYAGQQYSWEKNGLEGPYPQDRTQHKLDVQDGQVKVSVQDTEAVIVELQ